MKKFQTGLFAAAIATGMMLLSAPALAQETRDPEPAKPTPSEKKEKAGPSLKVGDMAPKVEVEKFVKGDPVTGFEKGKTYVVEFWATWCGPCVKAFPHLTELQAKHKGKVTFIGVNVWEDQEFNDETLAKVEAFVKKQGDRMGYTVAYDGGAKKTDTAYMKASGQRGIPSAFIVNGDGKIAWMGHPMGMDKVLDEVIAGKWDIQKAIDEQKEAAEAETARQAAMKKARPVIERMQDAMEEENWDDAVKAMDDLKALDPKQFGAVDMQKFMVLLNQAKQPAKAYAMKDTLLGNKMIAESAQTLNQIAWSVVDPDADIKDRNADFAIAFAEKADALTKSEDPAIIDTLAACHWLKGNKDRAIELQEKAVRLCKDNEDYEMMKGELEDRLKEYKAKK